MRKYRVWAGSTPAQVFDAPSLLVAKRAFRVQAGVMLKDTEGMEVSCIRGHLATATNRAIDRGGKVDCIECKKIRQRAYRRRQADQEQRA